jgi:hypothetical protein
VYCTWPPHVWPVARTVSIAGSWACCRFSQALSSPFSPLNLICTGTAAAVNSCSHQLQSAPMAAPSHSFNGSPPVCASLWQSTHPCCFTWGFDRSNLAMRERLVSDMGCACARRRCRLVSVTILAESCSKPRRWWKTASCSLCKASTHLLLLLSLLWIRGYPGEEVVLAQLRHRPRPYPDILRRQPRRHLDLNLTTAKAAKKRHVFPELTEFVEHVS